MHSCTMSTTVRGVIETMGSSNREVSRLLVVKEPDNSTTTTSGHAQNKLIGIVTTYDILRYLLTCENDVKSTIPLSP